MANEMIKVFQNNQFGEIRTVMKDGEPWFVAADVCKALEISKPENAYSRLDEDEKMTTCLTGSHSGQRGGAQFCTIVNEPGLYSLVLSSRKPEAKAFKRWITHEVIPDIRRHGMYAAPETIESWLNNPDTMITVLTKYKEEKELRMKLQNENKRLAVENDLLYGENSTWDERTIVGTLINHIAGQWGNTIGNTWLALYKEAKKKYHFDLVARKRKYNGRGNPPVLDFATEDEIHKLAIIAATVAKRWQVDFVVALNPVNADHAESLVDYDSLEELG